MILSITAGVGQDSLGTDASDLSHCLLTATFIAAALCLVAAAGLALWALAHQRYTALAMKDLQKFPHRPDIEKSVTAVRGGTMKVQVRVLKTARALNNDKVKRLNYAIPALGLGIGLLATHALILATIL